MSTELTIKDLRANSVEELGQTLTKLQQENFQYNFKKTTNQLENTMLIRKSRRDIARVKTVLNEKRGQATAGQKE
ncbi:MAG: 50S ribosomal protein L29 [Deltaproteobacteria bacterium]|nr:50S ribosomal protein L29 [Deltaproteobacteria bacterium]